MRTIKSVLIRGVAAAGLIGTGLAGAAGTGSAAGDDFGKPLVPGTTITEQRDVSAERTNGHSFLEINGAGQLVYWTRAGASFVPQVRGTDWANTRAITSLDETHFIEIKGDFRLSLWTWNGSFYTEKNVGQGWEPARLVSGVAPNAFLEINNLGDLRVWYFDGNYSITGYDPIGTQWDNTRAIAGKDFVDFIEIEGAGAVSEWYDFESAGHALRETRFDVADFTAVRLIVGTDFQHFLVILTNGDLYEFTLQDNGEYTPVRVGQDWGGTRLIG
ncbi:hypothetical protein KIPE111705_28875 [Kibdelosporangium persicum]|uniref:Uncharacterized protein n=1 Tax=Kibdelosporangium persicum TaxID=2698649 RepID=A0ABX2F513_9PSEU|nr:hypothetical protein [Kibdelosporangium persicum]NRN66337.1 hypothetical protein [Kibdelosporangium persicum]